MGRASVSPVLAAAVLSMALALAVWTLIGLYAPEEASGPFSARILVLIALAFFVVALAGWSRLRGKRDHEL
ncbi:MAG TPA: hypothetical protein VLY65_02855 [Nitrososphaerales archaeon]|nr:hypothetical protein [Nitrososphaerales archaeon]